jgi:hypothetical protein
LKTHLLPTVALAVEFVMLVVGMDDTGWWNDEGVWERRSPQVWRLLPTPTR